MASKLLSNEFQKHICLDYECTTIEEAIHKAGDLLVQVGCVKPPYINGMIRREQETSTDIGLGVMIPPWHRRHSEFCFKPGNQYCSDPTWNFLSWKYHTSGDRHLKP